MNEKCHLTIMKILVNVLYNAIIFDGDRGIKGLPDICLYIM